jgi:sugar phosphate isomerase/epimerase
MLRASGGALAVAAVAPAVKAEPASRPAGKPVLCLFSKALQARLVKDLPGMLGGLGITAVDLTVRPGGHVLPERVKDDLPAAYEAFKSAGIAVPMITTAINDPDAGEAEAILATAAKLGIRYAKIGYYQYGDLSRIHAVLAGAKSRLKGVVALFKQYGVTAGVHNHSGAGNIGAAMWDVWDLIRDHDPAAIGSYFDLGHATAEGAAGGWNIGLHLLLSRIVIVGVKDVCYMKDPAKGWGPKWGPLGSGMVKLDEPFRTLKQSGFAGPITLHVEYGPFTARADSDDERMNIEFIRRDWTSVRETLKKSQLL